MKESDSVSYEVLEDTDVIDLYNSLMKSYRKTFKDIKDSLDDFYIDLDDRIGMLLEQHKAKSMSMLPSNVRTEFSQLNKELKAIEYKIADLDRKLIK